MNNLLIFDYDGVIVDTFDVFYKYFIKACRKEGVEEIKTKNDFLKLYNENVYESMFKMGLSREKILKIVLKTKDGLLANQGEIKLFEDIKKVLGKLAKSNVMYVVTSSETNLVRQFLKSHKIHKYFKDVIGSDKEHNKIKKINAIKKIHPNKKYFYIGDTKGDIKEGKQAGVKTVAVSWGWHKPEFLRQENPDYIAKTPTDLLEFFKI